MPPKRRVPKYQHHKPSGQAYAEFAGYRLYLGKHDSAASWAEYHRAVAAWLAGRAIEQPRTAPGEESGIAVVSLARAFLEWADKRYVKNGEPTTEPRLFGTALAPVISMYGQMEARDFGPLALRTCRDKLVADGHCRSKVNSYVGRIVRVWKWGVSHELVPESAWRALRSVEGLRAGETPAPEMPPVLPVSDDDVAATLPYLSPTLRAMVELQLATGMRPGEVCRVRTVDIDQSAPVWRYTPATHKAEHHGRRRTVPLGPQAQAAIKPWLRPDDPTAPLFSPAESKAWYLAQRAAGRKTKRPPSQLARKPKRHPKRKPGRQFNTASYGHAIAAACARAKVSPWAPNQLRHNAGTRFRAAHGIEAARVLLGHASAVTSEIYAEADEQRAAEIAASLG